MGMGKLVGSVFPIKEQKARVALNKTPANEAVEPPKRPFLRPSRPNSRGLVSHIWQQYREKDYE